MKRQPICLVPQDSKRLNVFALIRLNNQLATYPTEKTTTGAFIVECIKNFLTTINKPTVIVLDNAPSHRYQPLYECLQDWQLKDLYVFFLPKYSPHLNAIEILWRKIKYEWLKPLHYRTWGTFTKAVKTILTHFGTDYHINFQYTILS